MLVIAGLTPAISSPVLNYTPGWREAQWDQSVLSKTITQCSQPGLEPGSVVGLKSSALTMRACKYKYFGPGSRGSD